jgi:rhodanese-related sulfurtransferase
MQRLYVLLGFFIVFGSCAFTNDPIISTDDSLNTSIETVDASDNPPILNSEFADMLESLLSHTVPELTVADVFAAPESIVFLDARELVEYEVSKLKGAIWVGYDDFTLDRLVNIATDARIVVYCSVGYRSEKISEQLLAAGYTDVVNLYGGIFEWVNQEQVVYVNDVPTLNVHAYDETWGVWLEKGNKVY